MGGEAASPGERPYTTFRDAIRCHFCNGFIHAFSQVGAS